MRLESHRPDDPNLWMDFARNDLRMAREGLERGYRLEALCYHAQQAGEKAFKALFVSRRVPFPKSHDLEKLMGLLPAYLALPPSLLPAREISKYSEMGRYPHGFEDVKIEEYHRAVELARAVVEWVGKVLSKDDSPGLFEAPAAYRAGFPKGKSAVRRAQKLRPRPSTKRGEGRPGKKKIAGRGKRGKG